MAKKQQQPVPGSGFGSYLLGLDETWWIREHPFNARCVKVKRLAKALEEAERSLEQLRESFDKAVDTMNEERANA